jgi:anaerobic ribonucleoside-triphosphate reductase activating protein
MLYIKKMVEYDLVNNPDSKFGAFTIWFAGCTLGCEDCFNKDLWERSNGIEYDVVEVVDKIMSATRRFGIKEVIFLGGEPTEQEEYDLTILAINLYNAGLKIWLYTGLEFEEIPHNLKRLMTVIKCGRYVSSLKTDGIPSSENQQFYKVDKNGNWSKKKFKNRKGKDKPKNEYQHVTT